MSSMPVRRLQIRELNFHIGLIAALIVSLPSIAHADAVVQVGDNIQQVIDSQPEGAVIRFRPGVYRMVSLVPKNNQQMIADVGPSGDRTATMTGSRILTNFTVEGANWVAANQTQHGQEHGECLPGRRCQCDEDLFFDDIPLTHVTSVDQVAPGKYFFDYNAAKIYFRDNPNGHRVETSVTRNAFAGGANGVHVENFVVEKYAVPAQFGAIGDQYPGAAWIVRNNETRLNHGQGIKVSGNSQIIGNSIHDNGFQGTGGDGNDIIVDSNEIYHNTDYGGFSCGWGCGGFKFAATRRLMIRNNHSHDNVGPGMWTDIENVDTTYQGNVVEDNGGEGIKHEISFAARIFDNIVRNNGKDFDVWAWGSQIEIQNSQSVEVFNNIITVGPAAGDAIFIIDQERGSSPTLGPFDAKNNYIHDNHITFSHQGGNLGIVSDSAFNPYTANNHFENNHYHVPNANDGYWQWQSFQNFASWQALGNDRTGTVDNLVSIDLIRPISPHNLVVIPQ